ncbi:MAG: hypothetical protein H6668_04330 [Ardenticatenaceae bacterium]|nr:hypothetical protein [Ardenticatenaceae bacterium]
MDDGMNGENGRFPHILQSTGRPVCLPSCQPKRPFFPNALMGHGRTRTNGRFPQNVNAPPLSGSSMLAKTAVSPHHRHKTTDKHG